MKTILCQVADEFIRGAGLVVGAAGSHHDVSLELVFSDLWSGYTKSVTWIDADGLNPTLTILTTDLLKPGTLNTYVVPIPAEPKAKPGDMTMTIKGVMVTPESGTESSAILTVAATFRVMESKWDGDAQAGGDVNATQAEQLQQQIDTVLNTISEAGESAVAAFGSAQRAETAAAQAKASASAAQSSETAADTSAAAAQAAQQAAESARDTAVSAAGSAAVNAVDAVRGELQGYITDAQTAKTGAEAAKAASETAKIAAEAAKTAAKTSETNAEASKVSAATSAATATSKANAASTSESSAATSANTANTKAQDAAAAALNASTSATDALTSKNAAATSAVTAKSEADRAKSEADRAESIAGANYIPASEKGAVGGIATLTGEGVLPVSQVPKEAKEIRIVANISERNAISGKYAGLSVYVKDATGDATVGSGGAYYLWDGAAWIKTGESESMDVVLSWPNIQDKPASFTPTAHKASHVTGGADAITPSEIGAAAKSTTASANISTIWTGSAVPYTQNISVPGATASNVIELSLSPTATKAQTDAYDALKLKDGGQSVGTITLRCWGTKNTIAVPVIAIVRGDL